MGTSIKLHLAIEHVETLENLPEYGIGYQIVDITLKDGRVLKEKVVVCCFILHLDEEEDIKPSDIEKVELSS